MLDSTLGKQPLSHEKFHSRSQTIGSLEQALAEKLPSSLLGLISKSFDIIGDIAIIELFSDTKSYEKSIAETLMKIHKNVRAVYSKAGPIAETRRVRPLHHVLGDNRTETIYKEHGCYFRVDISKAFFSPRLSTEHKRVADQVQSGECVVDMFAGVGPFSVLIAKRLTQVKIHSIDANPEAAKLMAENARLNRVQDRMRVWSGDARTVIAQDLRGIATRVIMNHPSQSKEFLEPASSALLPEGGIVHYYTFAEGPDSESKAESELAAGLSNSGWKIGRILASRNVRGVAPMKWQVGVDAKIVPA